jgi:adenine-specific DNA-methyltransferase
MNGTGVFFKYQRLEQYEEALENIAFTAPADACRKRWNSISISQNTSSI